MAKLGAPAKVVITLAVLGIAGVVATVGYLARKRRAEEALRAERMQVIEAIERKVLAGCRNDDRWPIADAGPVGPGYAPSFEDDEQFAQLDLEVGPSEHYVYLTRHRPVLGSLLIYAVAVPGTPFARDFHVRKCVRERFDGGRVQCSCRWPRVVSPPTLPAPLEGPSVFRSQ